MNAEKVEKTILETFQKLEKLKLNNTLGAELCYCWVSFKSDNNPVGVIEKGRKAIEALKEGREKNSKSVSKKLIEDLEKALSYNLS